MDTSERNLEDLIEQALLAAEAVQAPKTHPVKTTSRERAGGYQDQQSVTAWEGISAGGYQRRTSADYDEHLCLIAEDVCSFLYTTQPKEWARFQQQFQGQVNEARARFLQRLNSEIRQRGTLDVLRHGVKANGCHFHLAYFKPGMQLYPELGKLYQGNIFSVVRQLRYSVNRHAEGKKSDGSSLDLAIFLNGLPIFTAELKNDFKAQTVEDAIEQYKKRDSKEPLFAYGRCVAHFAVDPNYVYMTTHLQGANTRFLPFNQGNNGGSGNPPNWKSFATAYLWERIWAREVVLDLVQRFIQEVEEEDDKGRRTGKKHLIFPRYHQLEAVRRLVAHARIAHAGQRYLIQHSAGSGKSNTIAWTAYHLSNLCDESNERIFDSIIIITDRRILDKQLQRTIRQFEQTPGLVENIDKNARQLKDALEDGKTIVVTTLQKFPVIVNEIGSMQGKRFAVLIDEAHSSQTGESGSLMKKALTALSLEEAAAEEGREEEDLEDRIVQEMKRRGRIPNASFFAFTATPKPKTLELFGVKREDGKFEPFSLYTMRQAIEEHYILDVLQNYTTYRAYWNLLKKIQEDPHYDRRKAAVLLKAFVEQHEQTIAKKTEFIAEHFHSQVSGRIHHKAKAMIVTASRLHAVRYYQAIRRALEEKGYPYKVLVAFSGKVLDGAITYEESRMNSIPESQTAETFKKDEYRILIVANKFQTGFDQPLLHTMYVDKKLGGVNAVQTLSRLNRTAPGKEDTLVLDFANEAEHIQQSFQPYYEKTLLSEATDPNLLYDIQRALSEFDFYTKDDIEKFTLIYYSKQTQDRLHMALTPVVERYQAAEEQEQADFRKQLTDYIRLYAFLAQIIPFVDTDLEKLYNFARHLLQKLPIKRHRLPIEVQQNIDLQSYRVLQTSQGSIKLEHGNKELQPMPTRDRVILAAEDMEPLSKIIADLNTAFGTDFNEEDKVCILAIEERLSMREDLKNSLRVNQPENARLTFNLVVNEVLQEMVDTHFKFYKHVNDDQSFANAFLTFLFERYQEKAG
ncbi:MAG: type I restriction endonuclease subunit R [Ktedonobacteraceae bacterium]|nr:type I restriction endonuclease subunit R [Ktedonobacteraceae bacterium]